MKGKYNSNISKGGGEGAYKMHNRQKALKKKLEEKLRNLAT